MEISRRDSNKDAIPEIQTKVDDSVITPLLGKRQANPTNPLTITPKKPRRAFLRRESQRVSYFYVFSYFLYLI